MTTIPKVIHYCWFGGKPHPPEVVECMNSWRRLLPDYRVIEWNETNFDVASSRYTKEAYEAGKFAFVTDYVRLKALYDHGGLYMDTDVEVLRPLDRFLQHNAFSGYEDEVHVPTAIMGSRAGNNWIRALLDEYDELPFIRPDGSYDLTTNVDRISRISGEKFGILLNDSFQDVPGVVTIYPRDYFCPKSHTTGVINLTRNSHAIHHFAGSWLPGELKSKYLFQGRMNRLFGVRLGGFLLGLRYIIKTEGLKGLVSRSGRLLRRGLPDRKPD